MFPFTLAWGTLAAYIYRSQWSINYVLGAVSLVLIAGLFLPFKVFVAFWSPAGVFVLLIVLGFFLPIVGVEGNLKEIFSLKLPSRAQLQEALANIADEEGRQFYYLKVVKDNVLFWRRWDGIFTGWNTQMLLVVFGISSLIGASVLLGEYFFGSRLQQYLQDFEKELSQFLAEEISEKNLQKLRESFVLLLPAVYYISCGIFTLIYLNVIRLVFLKRKGQVSPFGEIMLFHLPENTIWFFIVTAAFFLLLHLLDIPNEWYYIPLNALLILAFLYFLNGISILKLFLETRFLAGNKILLFAFLIALLWQPLFVVLVLVIFLLGLVDFFFSFRNKTLQPVGD